MFNKKVSFEQIAKNLNDFSFKCKCATISIDVEIYKKETDKLISIAPMSVLVHNGTMNPEYADKFFEDLSKDVKIAFAQKILENEKKKVE